jgi:hypothetical protein
MKLEFSWQIFDKHVAIKLRENPSSWSHADSQTDGRTERYYTANSYMSQFWELD